MDYLDNPSDLVLAAYETGLTAKREGNVTNYFRSQGYLASVVDCAMFYGDKALARKAERYIRKLCEAKT
jgi:hypothetical protein